MSEDLSRLMAQADGAASLPTFDETVLIQRLGGDAKSAADILRDFLRALQRAVDDINAAFRDDHAAGLIAAAHDLKSSSRAVGAMQLGELCELLEAAAQPGLSQSVQQMIVTVMAEIEAVAKRVGAAGG